MSTEHVRVDKMEMILWRICHNRCIQGWFQVLNPNRWWPYTLWGTAVHCAPSRSKEIYRVSGMLLSREPSTLLITAKLSDQTHPDTTVSWLDSACFTAAESGSKKIQTNTPTEIIMELDSNPWPYSSTNRWISTCRTISGSVQYLETSAARNRLPRFRTACVHVPHWNPSYHFESLL